MMYFRAKKDSNFIVAYLGFGKDSNTFKGVCIQGCADKNEVYDDWIIDDFELIS